MKISVSWLRDYVDIPIDFDPRRLVKDLTMSVVEVEDVVDLSRALQDVLVATVVQIESGGRTALCAAGGPKPVRALLGGLRVEEGWLVGIRSAAQSEGKCESGADWRVVSAAELELSLLFPPASPGDAMNLSDSQAESGTGLAEAIGWDDRLLDIDNKSLTNRPDLWGHYGIAREIAAIYGLPLKPLPQLPELPMSLGLIGTIEPTIADRLLVLHLRGATATAAPFFLRSRLARLGQQTINLYVDLTNYVMLAVGQPCHVYSGEAVEGPLSVRWPNDGDKLVLLNGKQARIAPSTPVIADSRGAVALAGVMGGSDSALRAGAADVLLEIGTFRAPIVRRAAAASGLRTEASMRFEKGLDTNRVDACTALFLALVRIFDPECQVVGVEDRILCATPSITIPLDLSFLAARLGAQLPTDRVCQSLQHLGFGVALEDGAAIVKVPTWRSTGDVSRPEDLVEEVARLHGYDRFPFVPPVVSLERSVRSPRLGLERKFKEVLASVTGAQEVITYPWVHDRYLAAAGCLEAGLLRLSEAPAPEQSALRPSLVPGLIEAVVANLRYKEEFSLFESGTVFGSGVGGALWDSKELLPPQQKRLACAFVGADAQQLFRHAKGALGDLHRLAHVESLSTVSGADVPWAEATVQLRIVSASATIGAVGLLSRKAKRLAGIKRREVVLFELALDALQPFPSRENRYEPVPQQPAVEQDLSLLFPLAVCWEQIDEATRDMHPLLEEIEFVDEYVGKSVPHGLKSITIRFRFRAKDRSVTSAEAGGLVASAEAILTRSLGAQART